MNKKQLPNSAILAITNAEQEIHNGNFSDAYRQLSSLLTQYPESGEVNYALGSFYMQVEDFDKAIHCFTQTCHRMPSNYHAIFQLMDAFAAVNSHKDVAILHEFMLKQFPQQPEVVYKSALYCSEVGNFTETIILTKRCINLCQCAAQYNTLQAYAWLLLIKVDPTARAQQTIEHLTSLNESTDGGASSELSMLINYAIGEVYHQKQETKKAFSHWQLANTSQFATAPFKTNALTKFFADIKQSHENLNKLIFANNSRHKAQFMPIFIIGLPRTGSTLLESLLSSHSAVESIGETTLVSHQLASVFEQHYQKPYPFFMNDLANESNPQVASSVLEKAAEAYISAVRKRQLNGQFIIDKLPANFQSIGLIKMVFPQAKIIHLSRNFEDVALSIFRHHFANNEPYFCDIRELAIYNKMYLDVMTFWSKEYDEQIFTLGYEDLVKSPSHWVGRVLEYCGLAIEENCFQTEHPEQTEQRKLPKETYYSPIKTLSAVQVRSPISTKSVGSASAYRHLLSQYLS